MNIPKVFAVSHKLVTSNIFPAIKDGIPIAPNLRRLVIFYIKSIGYYHMIIMTIFVMTASMAWNRSANGLPVGPILPSTNPITMQNVISPAFK